MASLSLSLSLSLSSTPTHPFPPSFSRRLTTKPPPSSSNAAAAAIPDDKPNALTVPERSQTQRKVMIDIEKLKKREAKERKEEVNSKIASRKAISIILRREATKALIEKKRGPTNSKKLLPRTVLEALHERIKALRPDSALKVFELLREQLWYRPNPGVYIKLIVMLGKCKQPQKADELFQAMIDEGCLVNHEAYTALLSAYEYFAFDKVQALLSDMTTQGIRPNTVTYNTLIDAYGKARKFSEMESTLVEMLHEKNCEPDVWTMNSTLRAFDSYGKAGEYEKMSAVMEYMQKYHYSWTIVTYNVVIDAFGKAGDLKQMEYLFRLMRSERIKPSCVTLCSLVRAYGQAGKPEKIGGVLRYIENSDVVLDTVFFNCLVDAYGRMGCFAEMREFLT
ncbi:pentatricopeptide repeat-containing protein [Quercus suber]|uniref:Pentatricopeptide repeat-containing protein n=1 Tax=Quercus suber TaxID=58331 RepID=A0AAW0KQL6_QUESU